MDEDVFAILNSLIANIEKNKVDYEYRLYYNKETYEPLFYTMDDKSQGDYIVVSKEQYTEGRYDVRIRNGTIEKLVDAEIWTKLVPNQDGLTTTRADNIMIVDQEGPTKWKLKTYYQD